jgi:hypothetical protein
MRLHRRIVLVGAVSALALAVPSAAFAHSPGADNHARHHGHGKGHDLVKADFVPSLPTDPVIFGVKPGGVPWVLGKGEVRVRRDGRTDVRIKGLQVLRADGTTDNPVPMITVTLYCGGASAAVSPLEPLSVPAGDARFRVWLHVPKKCAHATVLVNPNGAAGTYIASATGVHKKHQDRSKAQASASRPGKSR